MARAPERRIRRRRRPRRQLHNRRRGSSQSERGNRSLSPPATISGPAPGWGPARPTSRPDSEGSRSIAESALGGSWRLLPGFGLGAGCVRSAPLVLEREFQQSQHGASSNRSLARQFVCAGLSTDYRVPVDRVWTNAPVSLAWCAVRRLPGTNFPPSPEWNRSEITDPAFLPSEGWWYLGRRPPVDNSASAGYRDSAGAASPGPKEPPLEGALEVGGVLGRYRPRRGRPIPQNMIGSDGETGGRTPWRQANR